MVQKGGSFDLYDPPLDPPLLDKIPLIPCKYFNLCITLCYGNRKFIRESDMHLTANVCLSSYHVPKQQPGFKVAILSNV